MGKFVGDGSGLTNINIDMYQGTSGTHTSFPIGHVLVAWTGKLPDRNDLNSQIRLYLPDNTAYSCYGSEWYDDHNDEMLDGYWSCRGYIGAIWSVRAALFQRVR